MGTISKIYDGYYAFATEDGTLYNSGTALMLGGAALVLLLLAYAAYNTVLAIANGVRRTGLVIARGGAGTVRLARTGSFAAPAVVVSTAAAKVPAPRSATAPARKPVKIG
ncbi:MAG: hypothetical protein ACT4PP_07780 [Sporichthyaceae bacterium]